MQINKRFSIERYNKGIRDNYYTLLAQTFEMTLRYYVITQKMVTVQTIKSHR